MTPIQQIRALCAECGDRDTAARECSHKMCKLWPFRGGRRISPWRDLVNPKQFSPRKALQMYREANTTE